MPTPYPVSPMPTPYPVSPMPTPHPIPDPTPHPIPDPTPHPTPMPVLVEMVYTDMSCYIEGNAITVSFTNFDPQSDDWVGIYESDANPQHLGPPLLWLYTCGTQSCSGMRSTGELVFGAGAPLEKGSIEWPLPPGEYVAMLLPDGHTPYAATAVSAPFTVKGSYEVCTSADIVFADMTSYVKGEDITIIFENSMPQQHDWVGIYEFDANTNHLGEPLIWFWTCGSQSCSESVMMGSVVFSSDHPSEAERASFPLDAGHYIAVLARNSDSPYTAYAVSDVFEVTDPEY
uniref:Uncharacterized protein n=1 Tax=Cyclophora tenuis TaxID=216820 RepID=A0A7S1D2D2_CYCTE|mmetsp:Transcript_17560/g.29781  ORF Transcript_17560/g.29781 Transcript_17560/m.29781 type:complete len:287 (+) Transcript_17560:2-862(+)